MPKIDIGALRVDTRRGYPPPHDERVAGRSKKRLGDAAGFKAGVANGHHFVNRSDRDAVYLEIGTRAKRERAHYSDVDLAVVKDEAGLRYSRKDGTPL